jgi:hypothetical protein
MLPYLTSFGAAFAYKPLLVVFPMAAGAYFNAKKGAMVFASRHFCKSAGVVWDRVEGPTREDEQTKMSRRPKVLRTSSMSVRVEDSSVLLYG